MDRLLQFKYYPKHLVLQRSALLHVAFKENRCRIGRACARRLEKALAEALIHAYNGIDSQQDAEMQDKKQRASPCKKLPRQSIAQ